MIITIVGGGNGGHILAGLAGAKKDVEVRILSRRPETFAGKSMTVTRPGIGGGPTIVGKIAKVSSEPSEVVPGSDIVIWCGPVVATKDVLESIAPYVQPTPDGRSPYVGCLFAQGCVHLLAAKVLGPHVPFFAFQSIPWLCRTIKAGSICEMVGCKKYTNVACHRVNFTWLRSALEDIILVKIVRLADFAAIVLNPANQIIHPARYWGIFKDWDGKTPIPQATIPWLYRDFDKTSTEALAGLDAELQAIKTSLAIAAPELDLEPIMPLEERIIAQYGDQVADQTNLRTVMATNQAYSMAKTPVSIVEGGVIPNASHRVVQDDIPHGLCVLKDIAERLEHDTPWIDRMIDWHQDLMCKEYMVDGKLVGKDIEECSALSVLGGLNLANVGYVDRPNVPCRL